MRSRLLLIEDNPEFSYLVCTWLAEFDDIDVVHTDDGAEAAQISDAGGWDMIVCDLELPGKSGLELLPKLRERSPNARIIVVTGHARFDYAVQAVEHANAFLTKPITKKQFQAAISENQKSISKSKLAQRRNILAIGAHPDDVEIGCGGTIAKYSTEGADSTILILTGGEGGGTAKSRRRESEIAADRLGAQLVILNLPDRNLSAGPETISAIQRVIQDRGATHVFTHSSHDAHQDHRNAHAATIVAARSIPNLLCYQSPSTTVMFQPNYFTEISLEIEKKLLAIEAHASQTSTRTYLSRELLVATARYWGRFCGYGLAEPFDAIRLTQN